MLRRLDVLGLRRRSAILRRAAVRDGHARRRRTSRSSDIVIERGALDGASEVVAVCRLALMRILIVTEIPAPFRIPLFNALAAEPDVELCVAFLAEHDPRRSYRVYREEFAFRDVVLPGRSLRRGARWVMLSRGLLRLLRRFRPGRRDRRRLEPARVLAGARRRAPRRRRSWVESTASDARSEAPRRRCAGSRSSLASGFLVPGPCVACVPARGSASTAARIFEAPNAVDFGVFAERVEAERADRAALRERLGLDGCVFLYVGRLEREKGLDVLRRGDDGTFRGQLVLAGSGPLEPSCATRGRRVVGQLRRDELVPWYAAADVLVLPSRSEPWGMTLNEGAAAGLPLVATDAVGAAHDLIEPGVNGFRVPAEDRGRAARGAARARVRRGAPPPRGRALARAGRALPARGVGGRRSSAQREQ